jgi:hypothetical protein
LQLGKPTKDDAVANDLLTVVTLENGLIAAELKGQAPKCFGAEQRNRRRKSTP